MKTLLKTTLVTTAALVVATSAAAQSSPTFAELDANADGQVSFTEFAAHAELQGKSKTLAAQDFTRLSQGNAVLTEDEYIFVDILTDQPYAFQTTPSNVVETPLGDVAGEVTYADTLDEAEQYIPAEEGELDLPQEMQAPVVDPVDDTLQDSSLEPATPLEEALDPIDDTLESEPMELDVMEPEPMELSPIEVEPELEITPEMAPEVETDPEL